MSRKASISDAAADTVTVPFSTVCITDDVGRDASAATAGTDSRSAAAKPAAAPRATTVRRGSVIVSMRLNGLSLLDQIVLVLVDEEPRHGFGIASAISGDEALSMAITVHRPLVYRAIDRLHDVGLVAPSRTEPGERGAPRTVWRATAAGRSAAKEWLEATVPHPRDARLELLAKFALRSRRGMANRHFAAAQRRCFEPVAASLRTPDRSTTAADLVRRWRYESVAAMIRLLRDLERTG
jgi:DNA-binding PadR family transcriptional regulator